MGLHYLKCLENESIQILRELVAETENPVMLYSIGKDSSVLLHLALKAFYPAKIPFPLLHIDTTWKFKEMIQFRDQIAAKNELRLLTYTNQEGLKQGINPQTYSAAQYTEVMKTEALKKALYHYGFDAAFGGARRDEEASRAKERICSFRNTHHRWDPKNQRPELWHLFNTRINPGESFRVFPLSNWTELDIWHYIQQEKIAIPSLYYAAYRPVIARHGQWIMADDDRLQLHPTEQIQVKKIRFRTLGCYPLTGAMESNATTIKEIIEELLGSRRSERQGRLIDYDSSGSMEKKKQEGYF